MDIVLLFITAGIDRRRIRIIRMIWSGLFAAAISTLMAAFFGMQAWNLWSRAFCFILIPYGMIRIAFGKESWKAQGKMILLLYGIVFVAGGMIQLVALHTFVGYGIFAGYVRNKWMYVSMVLFLCFSFYMIRVAGVRKVYGASLCQVRLIVEGKQYQLSGLIDTGNSLRDPFFGNAVHVINGTVLDNRIPRLHYIPYHAVGVENGMLPVFFADSMEIRKEGEVLQLERPEIAICEGSVSWDGIYEILLHSEILK